MKNENVDLERFKKDKSYRDKICKEVYSKLNPKMKKKFKKSMKLYN